MILGVDHVALSCSDVVEGSNFLLEAGYQAKFVQRDLLNHPSKASLLKTFEPVHDVAYCQKENSVSLELTRHSPLPKERSTPYRVMVKQVPLDSTVFPNSRPTSYREVWCAALGCSDPRSAMWRPFNAEIWYDPNANDSGRGYVQGMLLPVTNLPVSENFWKNGLRFQVEARGTTMDGMSWTSMAFRSRLAAWSLRVVLVENSRDVRQYFLDEPGFTCIALITTCLAEDHRLARAAGGRDGSLPFNIEVFGKPLTIVILRGPDNELIELIQFQR